MFLRFFLMFISIFFCYSEYDDYGGNIPLSFDENECISPTDSRQWIYDRNRTRQASLHMEEIDEDDEEPVGKDRRDSDNFQLPELDDMNKARLLSCMDEIRSVSGESYSDKRLVEVIIDNDYDFTKSLDMLLNSPTSIPAKRPKVTEVEKGILFWFRNDFVI